MEFNGKQYGLQRVQRNRYNVQRWVQKDNPKDIQIVQSGVDDPQSTFLNHPEKFPKQVRYHEEFKAKEREEKREADKSAQELVESKEWIHREQHGKVHGVQRLGFKPVTKNRSWW